MWSLGIEEAIDRPRAHSQGEAEVQCSSIESVNQGLESTITREGYTSRNTWEAKGSVEVEYTNLTSILYSYHRYVVVYIHAELSSLTEERDGANG